MAHQTQWNKNTKYALDLYKHAIRTAGLWPLDDRASLRVFLVATIQITLMAVFVRNIVIKGNCGGITEFVDAITLIGTSTMAVIKIILSWLHQKRVSSILKAVVQDWAHVENNKSRHIMLRYAYVGRVVFMVQMFGVYMTIIPLILTNLPNLADFKHPDNASIIGRSIPIGPECWVDPEMSSIRYCAYYIFVCIHLFLLATVYLGVDVFAFGLAMHLCGQFELLSRSLDELDVNKSESTQRKIVTQFSKRHSVLLKLAEDFEAVFHMLIFFELGTNTFIISISEIIFLWAFKIGDTQIIAAMITRIYLMYIQIFMFSHIGEHLTTRAQQLQVAIYNSPWYKISPFIARDMKFIMMRNNQLFHLTAGKIWHMNYENFKTMLKSMFSYFSILRLMFNE